MKNLESQAQKNVDHYNEVKAQSISLEKSIASYKDEYAVLISEAQAIKTSLNSVGSKVKNLLIL